MELSKQIRKYRDTLGWSQDDLAQRIFVSRQTISNWETDKTYPDIKSLLMLSALFQTTLDDLVKGDVEMMKKEMSSSTDVKRMHVLSIVIMIALLVGCLTAVPIFAAFGVVGAVILIICFAVAMPCAIIVEGIKKRNNVQTYSEIVAFMNGEKVDEIKAKTKHKYWFDSIIGKLIFGMVVGLILVALGLILAEIGVRIFS
jgi:DNA-binding XRE family transcriptional regulator